MLFLLPAVLGSWRKAWDPVERRSGTFRSPRTGTLGHPGVGAGTTGGQGNADKKQGDRKVSWTQNKGSRHQRFIGPVNRNQKTPNESSRPSWTSKYPQSDSRSATGRSAPGKRLGRSSIKQRPRSDRKQASRRGRQVDPVKAGIDFSTAVFDEEVGKMCVTKEEEVESVERQKVLECTHKMVEKCHYTYVTIFTTSQEEDCEENFEKKCQITFKLQAYNETLGSVEIGKNSKF